MANRITWVMAAGFGLGLLACQGEPRKAGASAPTETNAPIEEKLAQYTSVRLTTDLNKLTDNERRMIPLLIDAARSMDAIPPPPSSGKRHISPRIQVFAGTSSCVPAPWRPTTTGPAISPGWR